MSPITVTPTDGSIVSGSMVTAPPSPAPTHHTPSLVVDNEVFTAAPVQLSSASPSVAPAKPSKKALYYRPGPAHTAKFVFLSAA
jgi:hypothetical protein